MRQNNRRRKQPVVKSIMILLMGSAIVFTGLFTTRVMAAENFDLYEFVERVRTKVTKEVTSYFDNNSEKTIKVPVKKDQQYANSEIDYSTLINQYNTLDKSYKPSSTKNIANFVESTKSEIYLEDKAADAYIDMVNAMAEDGIEGMVAVSGYRSYSYQSTLYDNEVSKRMSQYPREQAEQVAATVVARPGTSEHQTGLAIDVSSYEVGNSLEEAFENTQVYEWLQQNSYKYGFIIRYTAEKSETTGIIFEPWHLRYLGKDMAKSLYNSGLCLEEYIEENK